MKLSAHVALVGQLQRADSQAMVVHQMDKVEGTDADDAEQVGAALTFEFLPPLDNIPLPIPRSGGDERGHGEPFLDEGIQAGNKVIVAK